MPAVMSKRAFDARTTPLRHNLFLLAEKSVGRNNADDVVQNALITAWQSIADFNSCNEQPAFLAWLQSILQYKITQFICAEAQKPETSLPASTVFEMCDGPGALHWEPDGWQEQRAELSRRLHNATLTTQQRECATRWVGGETLQAIGDTQDPPIGPSSVHYIIQRVARQLRDLEDVDAYDPRLGDCIKNLPAAQSYPVQVQYWNRVRREANAWAMMRCVRRPFAMSGGH